MKDTFWVEDAYCNVCGHTMISDGAEIYCPNMCAGDKEIIEYYDRD